MHYRNSVPCDMVYDDLQPLPNPDPTRNGGIYGPYLISSFTRGTPSTTTVYWTMSTWNPYEVMLMKTRLRLDGSLDR